MTTEHFTLQGARAATIAESTGRATMFLGSVSAGGVKHSGALTELLVAGRDFPTIRLEDTLVLLVQSASRLLTGFSQRLGRYAERTLTRRGVEVRTKTHITGADGRQVTVSDGSVVLARTVVWSGGVAPLVASTQPEPDTGRSRRGLGG